MATRALRRVGLAAALWMVCGGLWAQTDRTEERIHQLETQVRALIDELQALKAQIAREREAQPAPGVPATASAQDAEVAAEAVIEPAVDEPQEEKATAERPSGAAEGVAVQDPHGRWVARFGGRIQIDYRHFHPEGILADTFNLRRARLGVQVSFLDDYLFRLEGEYASGNAATAAQSVTATHAYLQANGFAPWALIRLGQSKPQFGLENTMSANFSDFLERGPTQNLIQTLNYDRGIMLDGTPFKGFNYGLSVTNGTGINTAERQASAQEIKADSKMVTARFTQDLAALVGQPRAVAHLGAGYQEGGVVNSPLNPYSAAAGTTEGLGLTFFTPQPFNAPGVTASNVDRRLTALEVALAYGSVKLQGEYWSANYQGTRQAPAPAVDYDLSIHAHYLNLMWMVTGEDYAESYRAGQFGRLRPRNDFDWKNQNWGALELGLRYSEFDASAFTASAPANAGRLALVQSAPVTQGTNRASAWTLGAKWLPNAYTRLMLNYIRTRFGTPVVAGGVTTSEEEAVTLRAQFDF